MSIDWSETTWPEATEMQSKAANEMNFWEIHADDPSSQKLSWALCREKGWERTRGLVRPGVAYALQKNTELHCTGLPSWGKGWRFCFAQKRWRRRKIKFRPGMIIRKLLLWDRTVRQMLGKIKWIYKMFTWKNQFLTSTLWV